MSVGLRGAHNLAWKLAAVRRGEAGDELLDTYEAEERHAVASFLRLMPYNVVERPSGPGGLLPREWLLRLGLRAPGLVSRFERAMSDLEVRHPRGALAPARGRVTARRPGGLRVGDRLPDAEVVAMGTCVRLHTLLAYTRWTLLAPATLPDEARHAVRSALAPWGGRVRLVGIASVPASRPNLVVDGVLILVRPDRHVGLLVAHGEIAALRAYLARWVGPQRHRAATDVETAPCI